MLGRPAAKSHGQLNPDGQSQSMMAASASNQPIQEEDSGESYGNEKKEEVIKQEDKSKRKSWRQKAKKALHKLFTSADERAAAAGEERKHEPEFQQQLPDCKSATLVKSRRLADDNVKL